MATYRFTNLPADSDVKVYNAATGAEVGSGTSDAAGIFEADLALGSYTATAYDVQGQSRSAITVAGVVVPEEGDVPVFTEDAGGFVPGQAGGSLPAVLNAYYSGQAAIPTRAAKYALPWEEMSDVPQLPGLFSISGDGKTFTVEKAGTYLVIAKFKVVVFDAPGTLIISQGTFSVDDEMVAPAYYFGTEQRGTIGPDGFMQQDHTFQFVQPFVVGQQFEVLAYLETSSAADPTGGMFTQSGNLFLTCL